MEVKEKTFVSWLLTLRFNSSAALCKGGRVEAFLWPGQLASRSSTGRPSAASTTAAIHPLVLPTPAQYAEGLGTAQGPISQEVPPSCLHPLSRSWRSSSCIPIFLPWPLNNGGNTKRSKSRITQNITGLKTLLLLASIFF